MAAAVVQLDLSVADGGLLQLLKEKKLSPAAINPWFTIAKIQLENREARARKAQNIVV